MVFDCAGTSELRAFVEASRSHVNTGDTASEWPAGIRTSVAIFGRVVRVVVREGCGVVGVGCCVVGRYVLCGVVLWCCAHLCSQLWVPHFVFNALTNTCNNFGYFTD